MTDKELEERCLDNLFSEKLPFRIPVDFKEGITGKQYYSGKCNRPRTVLIEITTFRGTAWNAKHYYGRIKPECPPIHKIGDKSEMNSYGYLGEDTELFSHNRFSIDLLKPTKEEEYQGDNLTSEWISKENLISFAKEVFNRRFGTENGWKLELEDYTND